MHGTARGEHIENEGRGSQKGRESVDTSSEKDEIVVGDEG